MLRRQQPLAAFVGPRPLRQLNSLFLPFADQLALELRERPHHTEQEVCHRGILAGEAQALFYKLDLHTPPRQTEDELPKVIQVPAQPVHRVTEHNIPIAHEVEHRRELRAMHVLTRGFIEERSIQLQSFELPIFILIERADPHVPDPLPLRGLPVLRCRNRLSFTFGICCSINENATLL